MGEGRRPLVWPRPQGFRVIGDGFWKDRRSPTMGEGELIANGMYVTSTSIFSCLT